MNSEAVQAPKFETIRLENFMPSWIGPHPFDDGFAIGSESGVVAFTDEHGKENQARHTISASGSAINGLDGLKDFFAVSTRQEICVFGLPRQGEKVRFATIPRGAHSLLASKSGHFLAPLGPDGIAVITPSHGQHTDYRVIAFSGDEGNFYQLVEMEPHAGRNYFVAACRSGGVGILDSSPSADDFGFRLGRFDGVDVIDVIHIGTPAYPHAIAAAGRNGELLLCRDIVRDEPPITLHYGQVGVGSVYRVFAAFGHLILLANNAFYVLADLANRLTQPVFDSSNSPVMTVPVDGVVDGYVHQGKWLMIVVTDSILKYDLTSINRTIRGFQVAESRAREVPTIQAGRPPLLTPERRPEMLSLRDRRFHVPARPLSVPTDEAAWQLHTV